MKKILIAILCALILLPITVFASYDEHLTINANGNMFVGGYKEIWIETEGNYKTQKLDEINLEYDPNYFSISKENISVYFCGVDLSNDAIDISITDEKVTLSSDAGIKIEGCYTGPTYDIFLNFVAKKAGESNIKLTADYTFNASGYIDLKSTITACPKCEETKCPVVEKDFIKDNAVLLMVATFVVGALLSFVLFHPVKKKEEVKSTETPQENIDKKE